jgi:hypothetical protein
MRWAGLEASMEEMTNAHTVCVGKPEGRKLLVRSRSRWEDNTKMNLIE